MKDYSRESLALHEKLGGKIKMQCKMDIRTKKDLTLVYSPGVAEPTKQIANDPDKIWKLTMKKNCVAVITDGSAVLGLGNIGPEAALPVMEGKCMLFKKFANIDAFPVCLGTQDTEEIIRTIRNISTVFGGVNLEDFSSPRCFEIEDRLQDLGIPVFHDDQHGTAIVVLAALYNACKLLKKNIHDLKVVVNGSGAAGIAIAKLLADFDIENEERQPVKEVIMCDSKGIIHKDRTDLNEVKVDLLRYINPRNIKGTVKDALVDADVFVGVSREDLLSASDIKVMAKDPIVLPLANPKPEIDPKEAYKGGAGVVGTGRSDYPNQVNNVLAFPGIFLGALEVRAKRITPKMKLAAAKAIANCVKNVEKNSIIPPVLNRHVATEVAHAVKEAYISEQA